MARTDGSPFFQRSGLFWIVTITLSMSYYTWVVFWSEAVPYDSLGPLGSLTKYLVDDFYPLLRYGWWLAWTLHLVEALVALKLCSDKGVGSLKVRCLWFVQTFLFGFASLRLLIKYKPDPLSKQH